MVKQVERLRLELNGEAFIDLRVLEHRHVDRADRLTSFGVPANSEERGAEKLCGSYVVDNPVRLAHGDRISGVQADEAAVARGCIHALANRIEGGAGAVEDRATGVQRTVGEVGWITQSLTCILRHRPRLTTGIAVISIDLPSTEEPPEEARLLASERQVVNP